MQFGLAMVIHVGTDDDLPPLPSDLPRCGSDWYPKEDPPPPPPSVTPRNDGPSLNYGGTMIWTLVCASFGVFTAPHIS